MIENDKLTVRLHRQWNFKFETSNIHDTKLNSTQSLFCHYCENRLDNIYSYIINCLKDAGILADGYKPVCCFCMVMEKYGLLELRETLDSFYYHTEKDILKIQFYYNLYNNGKKKRVFYEVRIHDYSKIKWD